MFSHLIIIKPLGMMYGSSGAFLSPENLVGRSGSKFPPDAATLSGLFFSANKTTHQYSHRELRDNLFIAGPFWAETDSLRNVYIPIPRTKIIATDKSDEWRIIAAPDRQVVWERDCDKDSIEPEFSWISSEDWTESAQYIADKGFAELSPWEFTPILHPKLEIDRRCTVEKDGLFLEYAVQMKEETCLIYLATHPLDPGWYKFGGENHLVEIESVEIKPDWAIYELLRQPIEQAFATITPAIWGSKRFSSRIPEQPDFPSVQLLLTDKPIPYRYGLGGRLGRGRYSVPSGSVYVLEEPIGRSWWDWPEDWFPREGFPLKHIGCGLSLPLTIKGLN